MQSGKVLISICRHVPLRIGMFERSDDSVFKQYFIRLVNHFVSCENGEMVQEATTYSIDKAAGHDRGIGADSSPQEFHFLFNLS